MAGFAHSLSSSAEQAYQHATALSIAVAITVAAVTCAWSPLTYAGDCVPSTGLRGRVGGRREPPDIPVASPGWARSSTRLYGVQPDGAAPPAVESTRRQLFVIWPTRSAPRSPVLEAYSKRSRTA